MRKKWIFFIFMTCLTTCIGNIYGTTPEVNKGLIHLNGWDFHRSGLLKLSGEWEFYWDTLLLPESFADPDHKPVPAYITVPLSWTSKKNSARPAKGYGTYRLLIEMPYQQDAFALRLYDVFSASRVWFDGRIIYTTGTVGTNKKASENIASKLQLIQINAQNIQLLENFHKKEKEMFNQEEELHQHLEELKALREQVDYFKGQKLN